MFLQDIFPELCADDFTATTRNADTTNTLSRKSTIEYVASDYKKWSSPSYLTKVAVVTDNDILVLRKQIV
ncbi:MAG: hypothetical protein WAL66_08410 [Nitrososphaeraceae archaeon]